MSIQEGKIKLDKVFSSLGDSTRREILNRIRLKPLTVLELASGFRITLPAVSKHIKILSEAGLLKKEKSGRYIYCSYNSETLKPAIKWISNQYDLWDKSFDKLEDLIKILQNKK